MIADCNSKRLLTQICLTLTENCNKMLSNHNLLFTFKSEVIEVFKGSKACCQWELVVYLYIYTVYFRQNEAWCNFFYHYWARQGGATLKGYKLCLQTKRHLSNVLLIDSFLLVVYGLKIAQASNPNLRKKWLVPLCSASH